MMRQDLRQAIKLVANGCTFAEAAAQCGLTRNAVAGPHYRAGIKTGGYARWRGTERATEWTRHAVNVRWAVKGARRPRAC